MVLKATDEKLIAHVCRWMANETETGCGAVSAEERRDNRLRMERQGVDTSDFLPDKKNLAPFEEEYVRRLRVIASRFENR